MKLGDLISYEWGYSNAKIQTTGILLSMRNFIPTKADSGFPTNSRVKFTFEILESNGQRNWYDVWSGEEGPKVISSC